MTGTLRQSGQSATVVYQGEGESLGYLRSLCFLEPVRTLDRTLSPAALKRAVEGERVQDLTVTEVNRLLAPWLDPALPVTFPWIRQKIFLNDPRFLAREGRILGQYGRHARSMGYIPDHALDGETARRFHREFYLPYIRMRFGPLAHPRSPGEMRRAQRDRGFILRILHQGRWVSGMACRVRGREVCNLGVGMNPDHLDLQKRGALSAAYYFLLLWARNNAMECVDLLRSRPHAGDGVFVHKRRWGAIPLTDPWPHTCLAVAVPEGGALPPPLERLLVLDMTGGDCFTELCRVAGTRKTKPDRGGDPGEREPAGMETATERCRGHRTGTPVPAGNTP
jgi:hypothetical protein